MGNAAADAGAQIALEGAVLVSFGNTPGGGVAGSRGGSIFDFLRNLYVVTCGGRTKSHPPAVHRGSISPLPPDTHLVCLWVMAILTDAE